MDSADEMEVAREAEASRRDNKMKQSLAGETTLLGIKRDNNTRYGLENDTKDSSLGGNRVRKTFIDGKCYIKTGRKKKMKQKSSITT